MKAARATREAAIAEAVARGDAHYQGTSCVHGHGGLRFVSNGVCVECNREWRRSEDGKEAKRRHYRLYVEEHKAAARKRWKPRKAKVMELEA
jgi:hypothetical protein